MQPREHSVPPLGSSTCPLLLRWWFLQAAQAHFIRHHKMSPKGLYLSTWKLYRYYLPTAWCKALGIPLMSVTSTLNSCCLPGRGICCLLFELFVWSWVDYLRSENGTVHIIKYTRFIVQEGEYAKVSSLSFKCRQLNSLSCGHSAWNSHWMSLLFWTKRTERPCSLWAHKARGKDYLFSLTCTLGALLSKTCHIFLSFCFYSLFSFIAKD